MYWGEYTAEACAVAYILNAPEPVSLLRESYDVSPTGGRLYALMGLFLVSGADFVELAQDFDPPEDELHFHLGCLVYSADSGNVVGMLLQAEVPQRISELARALRARRSESVAPAYGHLQRGRRARDAPESDPARGASAPGPTRPTPGPLER